MHGSDEEMARYEVVLDTVEDGVYMTDADRRITYVNDAAVQMTGYDRDQLVGGHLFDFLADDQLEVAKQNAEYLLDDDTSDVITFELEVHRADGSTFPAETRATLLPGDGFSGTVGIIRDVSDRKERQRELERKNERLEQFADVISHDLRNPLNVASLRLELAREDHESPHLADVADALDRMSELIDDLHELARQGQQITRTEPVAVQGLAHDAWNTVATDGANFSVQGHLTVEADPTRLRQLFENLFRNAVDHCGPETTVRVGTLDDARGFFVEDDGPGIPEDEREAVFKAGVSSTADGTGLGLPIVRTIAKAHDWTVGVREGALGGAKFAVVTERGE